MIGRAAAAPHHCSIRFAWKDPHLKLAGSPPPSANDRIGFSKRRIIRIGPAKMTRFMLPSAWLYSRHTGLVNSAICVRSGTAQGTGSPDQVAITMPRPQGQ